MPFVVGSSSCCWLRRLFVALGRSLLHAFVVDLHVCFSGSCHLFAIVLLSFLSVYSLLVYCIRSCVLLSVDSLPSWSFPPQKKKHKKEGRAHPKIFFYSPVATTNFFLPPPFYCLALSPHILCLLSLPATKVLFRPSFSAITKIYCVALITPAQYNYVFSPNWGTSLQMIFSRGPDITASPEIFDSPKVLLPSHREHPGSPPW